MADRSGHEQRNRETKGYSLIDQSAGIRISLHDQVDCHVRSDGGGFVAVPPVDAVSLTFPSSGESPLHFLLRRREWMCVRPAGALLALRAASQASHFEATILPAEAQRKKYATAVRAT